LLHGAAEDQGVGDAAGHRAPHRRESRRNRFGLQ
jgi:hypothetical protein